MRTKFKFSRIIPSLLILIATTFSFTSCKLFHRHEYEDYLAKAPTCTEIGLIKKLCIECGKFEYTEIAMSEHNYVNDICTQCGRHRSDRDALVPTAMPNNANNNGMWSFSTIHAKACSTMKTDVNYSLFISSLSGASLKNASVDSFGMLHVTVTYPLDNGSLFELPVMLTVDKVSPSSAGAPIGVLRRADIENNELFLTYTTGAKLYAGKILGNGEMIISGFGMNYNKELVIYYSNNTIAYAGKFASN